MLGGFYLGRGIRDKGLGLGDDLEPACDGDGGLPTYTFEMMGGFAVVDEVF